MSWATGLALLLGPIVVLAVAGALSLAHDRRRQWTTIVLLGLTSTTVWLVYVGLYQHETPCGGRSRCPTVYGYDAPLADESSLGLWLLVLGFAIPGVWLGWRRTTPPALIGASLAAGPTALAFWTAPRGDNDGLWLLVVWMLPILGALAAGVAAIASRVSARRQPRPRPSVVVAASAADRVAALAIDAVIVGAVLVAPLTALSHAKLEVLAGILGLTAATAYLALPIASRGHTFGQSLVGLSVRDVDTDEAPSLMRAILRSLIVVLEVAGLPTLILGAPAVIELLALAGGGRTLTDRLVRTAVVSIRPPPPASDVPYDPGRDHDRDPVERT